MADMSGVMSVHVIWEGWHGSARQRVMAHEGGDRPVWTNRLSEQETVGKFWENSPFLAAVDWKDR
jgi:hypothetical protein